MFLPPSTRPTSLTAWEIIYCAAAIKFGDYCCRKSPWEISNGNLEAWGVRGQNTHFHRQQEEEILSSQKTEAVTSAPV